MARFLFQLWASRQRAALGLGQKFRARVFGFRVSGLGFRVSGLGFRVALRVLFSISYNRFLSKFPQRIGLRVDGSGFMALPSSPVPTCRREACLTMGIILGSTPQSRTLNDKDPYVGTLNISFTYTQRAQNPVMKEYSLNHNMKPLLT